MIEQEKEKEKVGGRPAKLKEKKGDRDPRARDKKTKETFFCWKDNMKIFLAAVTKCEMLAATNAR